MNLELIAIALLLALNLVLLLVLLLRKPPLDAATLASAVGAGVGTGMDKAERSLRQEITESARAGRQESTQALAGFQQTLLAQGAEATRTQNAQIDAFAQQLTRLQGALVQQGVEGARTQTERLDTFAQQIATLRQTLADALRTQLQDLSEANARRLAEVRGTMEQQLTQLQASNATKLDEMRQTVDEKLQGTLEARLGESFKQVAERLEQVYKGLGEMQRLAQDVGSLNRVLTNVKTRGVFGEVQLAGLLEQVFTREQYAANVETVPGSNARVEFAIRLPGRRDDGVPLWLPIDAKFPREDYERLLAAQDAADPAAAESAAKAIEARLRLEARTIREKYIAAPHTTDFGILFLPTEGLYAEALRRPGLAEALHRDYRITLAGPTTLLATLSSFQMGFRTLALEKRSAEVWEVLGAVKTEFGKFGDFVAKVKGQAESVVKTLDHAQTRTNMMNRALKKVEALPDAQAQTLLPGLDEPEGTGA